MLVNKLNPDNSPKNSTSWESLRSVRCEQGEEKNATEVYVCTLSKLFFLQRSSRGNIDAVFDTQIWVSTNSLYLYYNQLLIGVNIPFRE